MNETTNTGTTANVTLAINSFHSQEFFPDTSLNFGEFPDMSQTDVKFPDIPEQDVTL